MSLVNVSLTPDRALITVDTNAMNGSTGAIGELSKMVVLPHCNIVLAGRGLSFVLSVAFSQAMLAWPSDFETIETMLPSAMTWSIDHLRANAAQFFSSMRIDQDDHLNAADQNLVMVGYSPSRGRIAAVTFTSSRRSEGVSSYELGTRDAWLSPWSEEWDDEFDPSSPELMYALARVQRVQIERTQGIASGNAIGGRLLLCELTKDEARFSSLGQLSQSR